MVGASNGLCEHASTVFYFSSTSNDRICLARSGHFEFYLKLLGKFSAALLYIEVHLPCIGKHQ